MINKYLLFTDFNLINYGTIFLGVVYSDKGLLRSYLVFRVPICPVCFILYLHKNFNKIPFLRISSEVFSGVPNSRTEGRGFDSHPGETFVCMLAGRLSGCFYVTN